jgi:phage host-nuclease inhibitor protein Gam
LATSLSAAVCASASNAASQQIRVFLFGDFLERVMNTSTSHEDLLQAAKATFGELAAKVRTRIMCLLNLVCAFCNSRDCLRELRSTSWPLERDACKIISRCHQRAKIQRKTIVRAGNVWNVLLEF